MEGAVGSIYLSHHVRHHQPLQCLAGESEQDMGKAGGEEESLDSPVSFLQWRTSVCKPPTYQEKNAGLLVAGIFHDSWTSL